MSFSKSTSPARSAFSLVEILVVVAIIGILAALAAWGAFAVIGGQSRRNTEATMRVLNNLLQSHWKFVIEEAKKDTISPEVRALAQPDPSGERAKVLWIKFRLKEAFPQTFDDINAPFVYTNYPPTRQPYIPLGQHRYNADYKNQVVNRLIAKTNPTYESSACLRIALSAQRGGSLLSDDQIKYAINDKDGDGIPEISDGWGTPLAFFPFAWNSAALQAANPGASNARNAKYADPVDTGGTLINRAWCVSIPTSPPTPAPPPPRPIYEAKFHSVTWPHYPSLTAIPPQQQLTAAYVNSVIVSAGPDGLLNLNPDLGVAVAGAGDKDNIYSFNLRGD